MMKFILKRMLGAIPTVFFVITITFLLVHLTPGDPFSSDRAMSQQVLDKLHHQYGMDLPLWQQYLSYLRNLIFHFDFGLSYKNIGASVNELIFPADGDSGFWLSVKFGTIVLAVTTVFGLALGTIAGLKQNGIIDRIVSIFSVTFIAIPTVITAPVLILIFAVEFQLLPPGQWGMDFSHLILPVIALSLPFICILAQIQRNCIIETLNSPFIRTAYAKGLSKKRIVLVHAMKPSLMPSISFLGPAAAGILTGTIIIEKVFALPGMGTQMVNAATNRDYSIVLALTIIYSILVVAFNLIVDILYGFIDPKARIK